MNIINKSPNKYYLYLHQGQEPVPWNPPDPHPLDWVDYTYFGKVFEAMEKNLEVGGLVFYFTWSKVDELPSYGENGQFKFEVQHLLKTSDKGKSRDHTLMAVSLSAQELQRGDYTHDVYIALWQS